MKKNMIPFLLFFILVFSGCGVNIVDLDEINNEDLQEYPVISTNPSEEVTLDIVDWSDSTKQSRQELNERFMAEHPNVTINYTTLTQAQFNETMLSGIRSGNAPDLFPLPTTVSFSTAINEGWFIPLDSYLNQDFFDSFKDDILQNNITNKEGIHFLLPEAQEIPTTLVYYNIDLLKKSGVDIDPSVPLTWNDFIEISKKVTEQGKGQYYGIVASGAQKNRIDLEFRAFSEIAGASLGPIDQIFLENNQTVFDNEEVLEVFNLYDTLFKDGYFHPDTPSLTAPEARKLFGEGKAAFIIQGSWSIPTWDEQNPNLNYDVMKMPVKDKEHLDAKFIRPYTRGWMGISSNSEHPDIAAEYLKELFSYEYQKELVSKGGFISIRKDITEEDITNPKMQRYYRYALEQSEVIQNPLEKNENIELVYNLIQPVVPDFGDIAVSIFSGDSGYKEKLEKYSRQVQGNLEQAVEAVQKKESVELTDFNYR